MKTIGKYIVRGLLGRGGMGKVFKVEHPIIGKIAALKLLEPDPLIVSLMGIEAIREMFTAEALTLGGLAHPNIIDILDFDESDGRPFYVMAYHVNNLGTLIGESTHPDRPSRRIRIEKAVDYARQTLQGLSRLHHAGIIHRDIKPFNLLITGQDTVKICDFGLSKLRGEKFAGPPTLKVGSAWYAPPEQEKDPDRVDVTADLYAVGIVMYRMLTGNLPADEYHPVARYNVDLDPSWDDFIQRAISRKAADRFASAEEMLETLEGLERNWRDKMNGICRVPMSVDGNTQIKNGLRTQKLRSQCIKIDPRSARRLFLVDRLWRPLDYLTNDFRNNSDGTLTDLATGLMWQQAGSSFPLNWRQAHTYIDRINTDRFGGFDDWRLPTIAELLTLLTEIPSGGDHCIEPLFHAQQRWIWSCDRRSYTAAWYVSIDLGFVSWQDFSADYYVRAVRQCSS